MNNINDNYYVGLLIARCEANATVPGLVALDSKFTLCSTRSLCKTFWDVTKAVLGVSPGGPEMPGSLFASGFKTRATRLKGRNANVDESQRFPRCRAILRDPRGGLGSAVRRADGAKYGGYGRYCRPGYGPIWSGRWRSEGRHHERWDRSHDRVDHQLGGRLQLGCTYAGNL